MAAHLLYEEGLVCFQLEAGNESFGGPVLAHLTQHLGHLRSHAFSGFAHVRILHADLWSIDNMALTMHPTCHSPGSCGICAAPSTQESRLLMHVARHS